MVVLAPIREVAKTLPVVRLATHKPIVPVDAVVGVELLATILAGKHIATVLPIFVLDKHLQRLCHSHYRGEPFLSFVYCPPTLIPASSNMISLTNLPSTPEGPVASR